MVRTVKRKKKGGLTNSALSTWVAQFVAVKAQQKQIKARYDELRGRLDDALEEYGYRDSDGHLWLDLEEPIEGYSRIKRERRTSRRLDEDALIEILEKKGIPKKRYIKTVEVLDEDAVFAMVYVDDPKKDGLTEAELDSVIVTSESWAVKEVAE